MSAAGFRFNGAPAEKEDTRDARQYTEEDMARVQQRLADEMTEKQKAMDMLKHVMSESFCREESQQEARASSAEKA